jgi:hypothetical protein
VDNCELGASQYCGPSGPRRRFVEESAAECFQLLDCREKFSDPALHGV